MTAKKSATKKSATKKSFAKKKSAAKKKSSAKKSATKKSSFAKKKELPAVKIKETEVGDPVDKSSIRKRAQKRNLMEANSQWACRPADERFWDLEEMEEACKKVDSNRTAQTIDPVNLRCDWDKRRGQVQLLHDGKAWGVQPWAFDLLAAKIRAPVRYLTSLPGKMAADLIDYGLQNHASFANDARVSLRGDLATPTVEAITSSRFGYIPNYRLIEGLKRLQDKGWRVPPARPAGEGPTRKATKDDVLSSGKVGLSIKEGDLIGPAGLYASDHDMFAFLVLEGQGLSVPGFDLNRGMFLYNSEVGAGSAKLVTFYYDAVCGNHIVWGASEVAEFRVRHIGEALPRVVGHMEDLKIEFDDQTVANSIKKAQKKKLGKDVYEVSEAVWKYRPANLSRNDAAAAFSLAEKHDADRVDPTSVWGMVCGVTRLSQESDKADERARYDSSAAALSKMVS